MAIRVTIDDARIYDRRAEAGAPAVGDLEIVTNGDEILLSFAAGAYGDTIRVTWTGDRDEFLEKSIAIAAARADEEAC